MLRPHHNRNGFSHSDNLIALTFILLSLGLLLPAVKRCMDVGFSWWLSILMGLVPVAAFWMAIAIAGTVFVQIFMWLESRER